MCIYCPNIDTCDEAMIIAKCRMYMGTCKAGLRGILNSAMSLEDMYRTAGVHYHSSQLPSRQPPEIAQVHVDRLRQLFEISCLEEYKSIFNKLDAIVEAATELLSRHCPDRVTLKQLVHHVFCVLKPRVSELRVRFQTTFDELDDYFARAYILFDVSRLKYESDAQGHRIAWQDVSEADTQVLPARKGEEWEKYRAWVWSLPETQRAIQLGRAVDDVALEMLFFEPDGFEQMSESQQTSRPPACAYSWTYLESDLDSIGLDCC